MQTTGPRHKGFYILPNLITTASLFTGFLAIIWAAEGKIEESAIGILFSALMDGLDGKIARWTNSSSEFGLQYDSLADMAAFGVAPAFMVYQWNLEQFGHMGVAVSFLFATCGALRLARFNIITHTTPKKFSIGITITASGCTLACLVLFIPYVPDVLLSAVPSFTLGLTMALGFLMVSRVRYASFKEYGFIKAHPFSSMVTAIMGFVLVVSAPRLLGFLIFGGYVLSGVVYTYVWLPRRGKNLPHILKPLN